MSPNPRNFIGVYAIAISVLASVSRCLATTYFIDYGSGSDAANGTSTSTPFKHCPTDSQATGTAASTTLTSGDVVKFKGDITYVLTSMDSSGITMVSGLTYDGNSDGSWGTGNAIFTDNNFHPGHIAFNTSAVVNNIAFKNLNFINLGGITNLSYFPTNAYDNVGVAENDGYGILFNGGSSGGHDITIQDCHFSQTGLLVQHAADERGQHQRRRHLFQQCPQPNLQHLHQELCL